MSLLSLIDGALRSEPVLRRTLTSLEEGADVTLAVGSFVRPLATAVAFTSDPRPTLVVVPGEDAAERFARQLATYLPHESILGFTERRDMPWDRSRPDVAAIGRRARALYSLDRGRAVVVVASARALLRALPPQGSHVFEPLVLEAHGTLDLAEAVAQLARMGYERGDKADEPGTFAVRGGILDVFPSDGLYPVRAELFGDEIETFRRFVPSTGQDIGDAPTTEVFACREVALGTRAAQAAERVLGKKKDDEQAAADLELIKEGVYFDGIEAYLPVFYKNPGTLTDFLSPRCLVVLTEPRALFDDMARYHDELVARATAAQTSVDGLFAGPAVLDLGGRQRLTFMSILRAGSAVDGEIKSRQPDVAGGEEAFIGGLRGLIGSGHRVVVTVPDRRRRERIEAVLTHAGFSTRRAEDDPELADRVVTIVLADVPAGYVMTNARLAVVSIDDAFPRSTKRREADVTKLTFSFKPGDFVVHSTHGIALFKELVRKSVLDVERDYLLLEYAKGDKLYVPVEQLDRVTKYVGPDSSAPRLTRLDTADWTRATTKARKAAKKLAFDLVDLYARRAAVSGYTFNTDTPWQLEMEAAFPFEETPDQLAAIADVKADMESDKPMDRLVCGDVGYGKTEVAIRAAFKASQSGKQVLVLCPTTILAQQHFTTFSERFAAFPVRVEVLSRFRTKAQQSAALEGFAKGNVDVLIGTHRLLSADVSPKDLGLVIIDEEQRFGVEHKEHLKNLREQVDVLTLSATPIPRTLQMALSGVRDMSTIDTPPPNRFPVQVHVGEYSPDVVSGAVRREMERGGQVYFISNRVHSIDDAVERVRIAAPEARIGVAHGQLSEHQLERIMERFAAGEIDVLVATTIVESGIDNPHTNTLIIEDSQRLGLAQLYQLKGRVGRSHIRAYAYFLFPRGQQLTEQAYERLTAVREHTELGSGIKVAMRDLEIRGAGSMLGADQSGNLSAVGFDLYAQMLKEAVAETRGEPLVAHPEIRVDLPDSSYLPEEYVPAVDERVLAYRRLAGAATPDAVAALAASLAERYGPLPAPARALIGAAHARALAAEIGATSVRIMRKRVNVGPVELSAAQRGLLAVAGCTIGGRYVVTSPQEPHETATDAALRVLDAILSAIRKAE
ncbi:MAG: transcription-repair coupling factor [Coriobacteriia bacterium]|nr:transcription-repair coupling factor [Coriobacteriia bacterium]MBN2821582.1 transcription-repair coupling factor [Coriobacteriia bacterium]